VNRKYWPGPGTGFRSLLFAQSLGTLIAGLGLVWLPAPAMAALAGGGICLAAHGWAAWQLRPRPGSAGAGRVLARVVWAEAGKVAIILTLFALSFRFVPDTHQPETLGAMLTGFIGAQGAGWLYIARFGGMDGTGQRAGDQDRN
jgi:ATP synthase protein I